LLLGTFALLSCAPRSFFGVAIVGDAGLSILPGASCALVAVGLATHLSIVGSSSILIAGAAASTIEV